MVRCRFDVQRAGSLNNAKGATKNERALRMADDSEAHTLRALRSRSMGISDSLGRARPGQRWARGRLCRLCVARVSCSRVELPPHAGVGVEVLDRRVAAAAECLHTDCSQYRPVCDC